MRRQHSQDNAFGLGDYDQPTEPMMPIVLSPQAIPAYEAGEFGPQMLTVPTSRAGGPVYPLLPPAPTQAYHGQPPGGAAPVPPAVRPLKIHRSPIPGLVGLFFVLVQLALLARVVFMLLGVPANSLWLNLLFLASGAFIWPFHLLAENVIASWPSGADLFNYLEILVAILAYGFFSRLFVRFLKALLNH